MIIRLIGIIGSMHGVRFMQSPPKRAIRTTSHQAFPVRGDIDSVSRFSRNAIKVSASMNPCAMRGATPCILTAVDAIASEGTSTSMHTPSSHTTFMPSTAFVSAESPAADTSRATRNGIVRFMPTILPQNANHAVSRAAEASPLSMWGSGCVEAVRPLCRLRKTAGDPQTILPIDFYANNDTLLNPLTHIRGD